MNVSQKCQYALRAVFELARRGGRTPIKIAEIAQAQAIPVRFLEVILAELKHGGFVESRRGMQGGYLLVASPKDLVTGQIIKYIEGSLAPVKCLAETNGEPCPLKEKCSFTDMWTRARDAVAEVYDSVTFQELVDNDRTARGECAADYCI
jgi:Rrf2 family protein